jgi:hypothetical protein
LKQLPNLGTVSISLCLSKNRHQHFGITSLYVELVYVGHQVSLFISDIQTSSFRQTNQVVDHWRKAARHAAYVSLNSFFHREVRKKEAMPYLATFNEVTGYTPILIRTITPVGYMCFGYS